MGLRIPVVDSTTLGLISFTTPTFIPSLEPPELESPGTSHKQAKI